MEAVLAATAADKAAADNVWLKTVDARLEADEA